MGGCASTCRQWQAEAQNDEEITGAGAVVMPGSYRPQQQPLPPNYDRPLSPPMMIGLAGGPLTANGSVKHAYNDTFFFRQSQEHSMAHLVRHPRLQPFPPALGHFGLGSAYEPIKLLGRGGTGQTWLCREADSGMLYALKMQSRPIPKNTVRLAYNEITITASTAVASVHATHIREAILTPSHLVLVLDFEAGGSAAEFVAQQIPRVGRSDLIVDEDFARYAFKQLVLGMEHLHDNHVAHRDIKLDNTLLDGEKLPTIKLCDFQFAKYWGAPRLTRTKTHLGTAVYMSPELIENRSTHQSYDPVEVDVWASGIWLTALLFGAFCYDNRPSADDTAAEMQILKQERGGPWFESKFVRPYVHLLSPSLLDLLNRILHVDPAKRISLEGIKEHPWMKLPLPPYLEAAWQRVRHAQLVLERRLAAYTPDHSRVQERNSRVYDVVKEAAAPLDQWPQSYQRLAEMCESSSLVDCSSVHGVVRINMQPEAVTKRLSQRALALLDTTPPGTPKRFSLPLAHVPSDTSLSTLPGRHGTSISEGEGSATGAVVSSADPITQLSPFASTALSGTL